MPIVKTKNNVKKKRNNLIFAHFIPDDQYLVAIFLWKEQSAAKAFHSTVLHLILSWEHLGILMCNRCRIKCKIFISPSFYLLTAQESKICVLESAYLWSISIIFVLVASQNIALWPDYFIRPTVFRRVKSAVSLKWQVGFENGTYFHHHFQLKNANLKVHYITRAYFFQLMASNSSKVIQYGQA